MRPQRYYTTDPPAVQLCIKCKAPLPEGAAFCPSCGKKQAREKRKATRRGNGTGSVYKRKGGSWMAVKVMGYRYTEDGKALPIRVTKGGFATKKEALDYLPKLNGTASKKIPTWADVYEAWKPTHRAGKSTMACYAAAQKWFLPVWALPFDRIDIDDLQDCLDDCDKGKRTRQLMKTLAGLLYKYAIPRHLASINLGQYLVVGGGETMTKPALPEDALQAITAAVGKVPGADYIVCQCYLGFRPSELLALDVRSYDRKERAFTGGSKTDAGRDRVVTVSPKIQPIIDRLTRDKVSGPVFCASDGGPMNIERYREIFYEVLDACGIENPLEGPEGAKRHRYTPHSCRHTFATLMKRVQGADKDKLALIGHSSDEMLRYYQDISYEDLRRITDCI